MCAPNDINSLFICNYFAKFDNVSAGGEDDVDIYTKCINKEAALPPPVAPGGFDTSPAPSPGGYGAQTGGPGFSDYGRNSAGYNGGQAQPGGFGEQDQTGYGSNTGYGTSGGQVQPGYGSNTGYGTSGGTTTTTTGGYGEQDQPGYGSNGGYGTSGNTGGSSPNTGQHIFHTSSTDRHTSRVFDICIGSQVTEPQSRIYKECKIAKVPNSNIYLHCRDHSNVPASVIYQDCTKGKSRSRIYDECASVGIEAKIYHSRIHDTCHKLSPKAPLLSSSPVHSPRRQETEDTEKPIDCTSGFWCKVRKFGRKTKQVLQRIGIYQNQIDKVGKGIKKVANLLWHGKDKSKKKKDKKGFQQLQDEDADNMEKGINEKY